MAVTPVKKPPTTVSLVWDQIVFGGRSGDVQVTLDSGRSRTVSSTSTRVCPGVVHGHGRCARSHEGPPRSPRLARGSEGERADTNPHRFTAIALDYTITGDVPAASIDRAIELSRENVCSVWHSMRQDIPLTVKYTVTPGA
jgi:hypothetical protein